MTFFQSCLCRGLSQMSLVQCYLWLKKRLCTHPCHTRNMPVSSMTPSRKRSCSKNPVCDVQAVWRKEGPPSQIGLAGGSPLVTHVRCGPGARGPLTPAQKFCQQRCARCLLFTSSASRGQQPEFGEDVVSLSCWISD